MTTTLEHVHVYDNEMSGYCTNCDDITVSSGVEPDARNYKCQDCGRLSVYGIMEAVQMGRITIADDTPPIEPIHLRRHKQPVTLRLTDGGRAEYVYSMHASDIGAIAVHRDRCWKSSTPGEYHEPAYYKATHVDSGLIAGQGYTPQHALQSVHDNVKRVGLDRAREIVAQAVAQ